MYLFLTFILLKRFETTKAKTKKQKKLKVRLRKITSNSSYKIHHSSFFSTIFSDGYSRQHTYFSFFTEKPG